MQQIHKNNYERIQKERSLVCPRCGGNLLVRNGPYGKFYGCSNYPNCRYKKNIRG
ncbi:MAG: topoisomerase DNA-binding C4 zinc finger domain-containing protein [Spirochaetia bacterium]|nr:topoisomerase DNA-binding C4 zinc finger domain-containing protein [Spirochaetia bacterium]